jgi:hypothetical protein
MGFQPKRPGDRDRVNSGLHPLCFLATGQMALTMMTEANGYRELITDLHPALEAARSEMMRILTECGRRSDTAVWRRI